jgi:uncharacterized membrane protein YdjX (TVP38/TMEM64 family)
MARADSQKTDSRALYTSRPRVNTLPKFSIQPQGHDVRDWTSCPSLFYPRGVKAKQAALAVLFVVAIWTILYSLGLHHLFSLTSLQDRREQALSLLADHFALMILAYMLVYVILTSISFPGATALTLAGGMMFGVGLGTAVVLTSATLGALGAFCATRFLFADWLRTRHRDAFSRLDEGLRREGAYYLFALRLNPVIPFFLINSLSGLTNLRAWTFTWISFIGMLPGTLLYVNAGTQIGELKSIGDILSPSFIASSIALGLAPLVFKKLLMLKN